MVDAAAVAASLISCFDLSRFRAEPFRYWLLEDILPADVCVGIDAIPVAPPEIGDTRGKRETHNSSRLFFGAENRARYSVCDALGAGFQSLGVVERIELLGDVKLRESFLRIEYCLDTDGFWLAPHTDIGVKKFTCLISLADDDSQSSLGTDIYNVDNRLYKRAPFHRNGALMFVPSHESLHGFAPRPIRGRRKSIILNYVGPEWRSKDQLAFPDAPISLL